MAGDRPQHTIIAPRELKDLVYRACRVRLVDSGNAILFAENLTHAQIHRGAAIEHFVPIVASSTSSHLEQIILAANFVELGAATALLEGEATIALESKTPLLAISQSLWNVAKRGIASVGISHEAPADLEFRELQFTILPLDQLNINLARQRHAKAYQMGLPVATSSFSALESIASAYLVEEAKLDEVSP